MTELWTGAGVALVTLFEQDGTLATEATAEHAARLVAAGVAGVLVSGTTGEASALSDAERVALVRAVRRACPDTPLLAGASGEWWGQAAPRAAQALEAGADAVLVAPPRSVEEPVEFFGRLARALGDVPMLAHHFPGVAGSAVPVDLLPSLPVAGIKDSSGDAGRLLSTLESWDRPTYVGSSMLVQYAAALGAAGAILAAANVAPEDCAAAWAGDLGAQRRLLRPHQEGAVRFPRGLKEAMARRYGTPTGARLG